MSPRSPRGRSSARPRRDDSPRAAEARARRAQAVERRQSVVEGIVRDGRLRYPDALPITARRDALVAAIRDHQVIVVAGETGSGKSTQLPKLCI
jgi:ATP-dependent helicase HrpA